MIKDKKILITGINGFLGKHLAMKLYDDNEIVGINLSNKSKNLEKKFDSITMIEGDISENNTLEKVNSDIDLILHFGSPTSVILFKQDPAKYFNNTINGMKNILEFAKKKSVKTYKSPPNWIPNDCKNPKITKRQPKNKKKFE